MFHRKGDNGNMVVENFAFETQSNTCYDGDINLGRAVVFMNQNHHVAKIDFIYMVDKKSSERAEPDRRRFGCYFCKVSDGCNRFWTVCGLSGSGILRVNFLVRKFDRFSKSIIIKSANRKHTSNRRGIRTRIFCKMSQFSLE